MCPRLRFAVRRLGRALVHDQSDDRGCSHAAVIEDANIRNCPSGGCREYDPARGVLCEHHAARREAHSRSSRIQLFPQAKLNYELPARRIKPTDFAQITRAWVARLAQERLPASIIRNCAAEPVTAVDGKLLTHAPG